MGTIKTYNNITFIIEDEITAGMSGKFTRTGNRDSEGNYKVREINEYTPFINSTDIDWQHAVLSKFPNIEIQNTGDLLDLINNIAIALEEGLDEVRITPEQLANFYTKDDANELEETLAGIVNVVANELHTDYATKAYVGEKIAEVVGEAPETLDTLKEIADALADNATMSDIANAISTKANVGDSYTKEESDAKYLTEHQDITGKANVGDSYTKEESDAKYLTEHQDISGKANVGDSYTKEESDAKYLTEHQDITGKANVGDSYTKEESDAKYLTEHQDITGKANVGDSYTKAESDAKYLTEHQDISTKANVGDSYTKAESDAKYLTEHQDITGKANVGDSYTKEESDAKYLTEHQDISTKANVGDSYTKAESDAKYLTEHQSLEDYASKTYVGEKIAEVVGEAPETLDTLKEIADALADNVTTEALATAISTKANSSDVYTKGEVDNVFQPKGEYLTEHQDISHLAVKSAVDTLIDGVSQQLTDYEQQAADTFATKAQVESIVDNAPENFDTLKELADSMADLKVIDVPAVPAVEGVHFTQEEIDAAQEGDEAYGKTVDDWKVEPVEGVEEVSHNMTIGEFVTNSMQAVDEKEEVAKVQQKYNALLTLLNLRDTDVNNVIINQELETSSNVTFEEPVDNIVIPETTTAYVVTAPLDDNATVTLTSNKYMTLDNTSEEPVSATVQRPAEAGETGTSGTTVYLVGQYDTLTLENVSPNVKSGRDAAQVNNVVISENNTKNLTLNLDLQDGATITNNSATAVTINDKNNEETVLAIVAPNSTVTLNGGTYTTLDAEVSDNTLVIKKNAHIGTLNVTKGNVKVEVPRESDIANIIDTINIAEGYSVDYLHDDITSANISKLTTTGTHTFQEDLSKSGNFSVGLFSSDDIVWDLNGHNLTSSNTRGYGIFILRGSAKLEINDTVGTGVVKNTANEYGFWTSTVDSKVVINGGNFEAATHVLYAQQGTIEVNGGTFKLTDAATADKDQNGNFKFLLNCHDADYVSGNAKIIVRGGTFYGFDPSNTYGEPGGPVSYVADGYESVQIGEENGLKIYKVKKIMTETDGTWEYIYNEQTWNESYNNGLLKTYYNHYDAASPYKEDLWNTVENRPANWNDIEKDGQGNPIEYEDGYHYTNCVRCWQGAINAPGAQYPWAAVATPIPFEGYIKFVYDGGTPVYPWGDNIRTFSRGFGIASIPGELGSQFLLDGQGNTTFDPSKLQVKLLS